MRFGTVEIKYFKCDNNVLGHATLFSNSIIPLVCSVSHEATKAIQVEIKTNNFKKILPLNM
jgi:hypothetical protein